jgi:putative aldouronate transport system substrate-binding protein
MLRLVAVSAAGAGLAACTSAATPAPTTAPQPTAASAATDTPQAAVATDTPQAAAATATTAATDTPQPTTAPTKGAATKIVFVESWFGIPQYQTSIDPVTQAITQKMQSEGLNIEIHSLILDNHDTKYPVLYSSGADFTMAFDAPWYKMLSLRDQSALVQIESLIDQFGPNLKKEITDKIYKANFMNGHLYGIPVTYYYRGSSGVLLREDLRMKYNAPAPDPATGWPSVEPYLQSIKKNEPNLIPDANAPPQGLVGNWEINTWQRWPNANTGGINAAAIIVPDWTKGTQFVDYETVPEYLNLVKLVRSWWQQGLVNKTDLPTISSGGSVETDFIFPGKAAACQENEPDYKFVDYTKQLQSSIKDAKLMGWDMTGMRGGKKATGSLVAGNFVVFNAGAPKEQQQAGIQYFDWLSSNQDNVDLWDMGIDGMNYKKEPNLKFAEIPGVDAARNYRRQWYVSGISGKYQRQPDNLPQAALDALTFFSTESNFQYNPYEGFSPDTKAVEAELTEVTGVMAEAFHPLDSGQEDTATSLAKTTKLLDSAGRQTLKQKLQKQLDDYVKAHPAPTQ